MSSVLKQDTFRLHVHNTGGGARGGRFVSVKALPLVHSCILEKKRKEKGLSSNFHACLSYTAAFPRMNDRRILHRHHSLLKICSGHCPCWAFRDLCSGYTASDVLIAKRVLTPANQNLAAAPQTYPMDGLRAFTSVIDDEGLI